MNEILPTGTIASLLARYKEVGGVVEHVLFAPNHEATVDVHRAAALATLKAIGRKFDDHFARVLQMPEYRRKKRSDFFSVSVRTELLTGRLISPDAFLGPWWDRDNRVFLNGQEWIGYAAAFRDPPYGLFDRRSGARLSDVDAAHLFESLAGELFKDFPDSLVIYEWSTECSNYFDAGREWWGTFFWTVEVPGSGRLICIAASSTD